MTSRRTSRSRSSCYPAARKANPDSILEGLEEYATGRVTLQRLQSTKATDQVLEARLKALEEKRTRRD